MSKALKEKTLTGLRKYKPYSAYKDSGVEWLGEVPEGWDVFKLKHLILINPSTREINSLSPDTNVNFIPMEALEEFGGLNLDMVTQLKEVKNGYTYFRNGDVVVAKITPCFENNKGAIAVNLYNGIAFGTTELHVLRANLKIKACLLFYITISYPFRMLGQSYMYGAAGQKRVPEDFILNFRIVLPRNLEEQDEIANFLDRETAKIDALIAKQERLIELLQEKRVALITQAVTKGLNPNVPMKDSGVEWLGEVPEHWEVYALKRVALLKSGEMINSDFIEEDGGFPVYGGNGLRGYTSSHTHEGDHVLIGRQGALCGNINYAYGKFWASEHAIVVHPIKPVDIYWLGELLRTMNLNQYSISAAQPGLAVEKICNIYIPVPPLAEQTAISNYLKLKITRINCLHKKTYQLINTLKEYRTALISAAVTGKIDVRGEVS